MSIAPRFVYGDLDLTEYPFAVEFGSDFGDPENVTDVVASMLADGEVLEVNRRSNRTLTIPVLIDGPDMAALASAEALLIAEADKVRNTLSVDPGDGFGATTVFDTFRAQPRWKREDVEELNGVRRYTLEIPALPHTRSVDKIIDDAGTPPSTGGTLVDACESTSGWSVPTNPPAYGPPPAAPAVDSTVFYAGTGSIKLDSSIYAFGTDPYDGTVTFQRFQPTKTGLSISIGSGGGYVSMAVKSDLPGSPNVPNRPLQLTVTYTVAGEREVTPTASESLGGGWVRYVFQGITSDTITAISWLWDTYALGAQPRGFMHIDKIELLPSATTDQQILKSFAVKGSARTPGAVHVQAPTDSVALSKVLLVTVSADKVAPGFRPDVRRWVTSGATTTDATALHGSFYANMGGTFDVPVSILTAGPHSIVALVKSGGNPLTTTVNAQLLSGSLVGPVSSATLSMPNVSSDWQLVTLGTVYLPPLPMMNPDVNAKVRITFTGSASLADAYMIPQAADFSIIDCGTGTVSPTAASSHLWIDSPSPGQPRGGWWRGPLAERVNARSAWPDAKRPGIHTFDPGTMLAFLVSTGAQGPTLTLEYHPAWYGNAAL